MNIVIRTFLTLSKNFKILLTKLWNNLLKKQSIALKRERVTVLKNLNKEIRILFNGILLEFEKITKDTLRHLRDRKQNMKETIKKTSLKTWKPAANHPWRLQNRALFNELRR